uniref:MATH domain-containing protein n=1 Tax=Trichuris muris TaxID=70415 RepID=A0A5S6Q4N9_TRIMR
MYTFNDAYTGDDVHILKVRLCIFKVHEDPGIKEKDNHPKSHQAGTDYIAQGSSTDRAANHCTPLTDYQL